MAINFTPTITKLFYGTYEFTPVPLVTWTTALIKDSKGESLFLEHTLDFTGTLCNFVTESGAFTELFDKKEELTSAVTTSGQELRITHEGVSVLSGVFPTFESINFEEGTWTEQIPYSLSFSYNEEIEGSPPVENFQETWAFTENEDRRSVQIQHDVSAVGVNTGISGVNNALENARTFVLDRTGYSNVPANHPAFVQASGLLPSGLDLVAYEGLRVENVDVQGGNFSVTEQFVLSSGAFTHTQTGQFSTDDTGITTVTMDGVINGLGRKDARFINALNAYNNNIEPLIPGQATTIYTRFVGSGTLFTTRPKAISISQNEFAGTINYNRTYDDDPGSDLPADIQDASISVQNQEPVKLHATIPICNRSQGAIVQDVGTTTPGTYSLSGSVTAKAGVDISAATAYALTLINDRLPTDITIGHTTQTIILISKSITKDDLKRTVNFSLQWQYTAATFAQDGPQQISG